MTVKTFKYPCLTVGRLLARADIFFFTLIWLMVLLVVGTVAQKTLGLYQAQHLFFSSFVVWLGPIPLPAGYTVMTVIFVNLLAKLVLDSPWHWKHLGIIVGHIGALLLLVGGFFTAAFSTEGSMLLFEGESADFVSDYHQRALVVMEEGADDVAPPLVSFPVEQLQPGTHLASPALPFMLEIRNYCRNCTSVKPQDTAAEVTRHGIAAKADLAAAPLHPQDEQNIAGAMFIVRGLETGMDAEGLYFTVESMPIQPTFVVGDTTYRVEMRRARRLLPFRLELIDFEKVVYPGTTMAKSYSSEVRLIDGDAHWHTTISMNEPLRYKGYTFFQSSFVDTGDREATVLAVVDNAGRLFPYISSIVMCVGLLIHLVFHLPRLMRKERVT